MSNTLNFGLAIAMLGAVVAPGAAAKVDTISGKINGYTCAYTGHVCPTSNLDPHLALESAFVLQQKNGDYYFLQNIPKATSARYVLQKAKVTGDVDRKFNSILVDEFVVNGKVVWSVAMVEKARKEWEDLLGDNI